MANVVDLGLVAVRIRPNCVEVCGRCIWQFVNEQVIGGIDRYQALEIGREATAEHPWFLIARRKRFSPSFAEPCSDSKRIFSKTPIYLNAVDLRQFDDVENTEKIALMC